MARQGVPLVDGGMIVDGQKWATSEEDGRHFEMIVPIELFSFLSILTSFPDSYPARSEPAAEGKDFNKSSLHFSGASHSRGAGGSYWWVSSGVQCVVAVAVFVVCGSLI